MATITAFDAKTRFGELLERVSNGEEIIIPRHEKPVARIVPEGQRSLTQVRQAVHSLEKLRKQIGGRTKDRAKLSDKEVRAAIEEGRLCQIVWKHSNGQIDPITPSPDDGPPSHDHGFACLLISSLAPRVISSTLIVGPEDWTE
jgi:prevent-host-death family protein